MSLFDIQLDLLIRLIKLARLLARPQLTHHLLEDFQGLETALAFVALDVQFDATIRGDRDLKFALGHKSGTIPVADFEANGLVGIDLFFDHHVLARANLLDQSLVDVLLHHSLA